MIEVPFIRQLFLLPPFAVGVGAVCLASQVVLSAILASPRALGLPTGPWTSLPGLTAHQVVTFPLMIYFAYHGCADWFFDPRRRGDGAATPFDRVLGLSGDDKDGVPGLLLSVAIAMLTLWDIPTGLAVPALRNPVMWGHHVGMWLVASIMFGIFSGGRMIGVHYASFFFGVIEASSIPLVIVDVFHPKRREWFKWLKSREGTMGNALRATNEAARYSFAVSYICLRALYFPYVVFAWAVPDMWMVANAPPGSRPEEVPVWTLYVLLITNISFAGLQVYWGYFVAQQIYRAFAIGNKDKSGKKK